MCLLFSNDRAKADKYVGYLWGVKGMSAMGGALTLAFKSSLFLPLWPAAALNILAFFVVYVFVTEPRRTEETDNKLEEQGTADGEENHMREKVHIILGAILNGVGSAGYTRMFKCKLHYFKFGSHHPLAALAFAPVLYETFLLDFVESGENPIMSESDYKLIYSLIALTGLIGCV